MIFVVLASTHFFLSVHKITSLYSSHRKVLKSSIFLKNRYFIIEERFIIMNTIIKCGT